MNSGLFELIVSRMTRCVVGWVLVCFLVADGVAVQPGDSVTFKKHGEIKTGEVIKLKNGYIFVSYTHFGRQISTSLRERDLLDETQIPNQPDRTEAVAFSIPELKPVRPGRIVQFGTMTPPKKVVKQRVNSLLHRVQTDAIQVPDVRFSERRDLPVLVSFDPQVMATSVRPVSSSREPSTTLHVTRGVSDVAIDTYNIDQTRLLLASADPTSGSVLAIVCKQGSDHHSGLAVISGLRDRDPQVTMTVDLNSMRQGRGRYVTSRHMLGATHFLIAFDSQIALFNAADQTQVWRCNAAGADRLILSPNKLWVAFTTGTQIVFLETATGRPLGALQRPFPHGGSMSFSPDGTMFAIADQETLKVYQIDGGAELRTISSNRPFTITTQPLIWPTNQFVITPTGLMVDLSSGFVIWRYDGVGETEFADHRNAGLIGMTSDELVSIQRIPHSDAIDASRGDLSDKVILRPGDRLRVTLDIRDDLKTDKSVLLENLIDSVQQAGYLVDDSAAATLSVVMGRSKTSDEVYWVIGPDSGQNRGNSFTVRYSGFYTKAELLLHGERVWKASYGTGMGTPSYQPRQEPYEFIHQPNRNTLKNFRLPKRVLSPEFEAGFGHSRVRPEGVE